MSSCVPYESIKNNIAVVKIFSTDHRWFPPEFEVEELNNYYKEKGLFRLIVPDHVKLKVKGKIIEVTFGSKKIKWIPTVRECNKLKKLIQTQAPEFEVVVKPIN